MAFIFPSLIPAGCIEEIDEDPAEMIFSAGVFPSFNPYNFKFTLDELMYLIWKVKTWDALGSSTWSPAFGPSRTDTIDSELQESLFYSPNLYGKEKMSDLVCLGDGTSFFIAGEAQTQSSGGSPGACEFSAIYNSQPDFFNNIYKIYKYDGDYYLPIFASIQFISFTKRFSPSLASGSLTISFGGTTKTSNSCFNISQTPDSNVSGSLFLSESDEREAS